jgi:AraC-like DNA-binding protein
MSRGRVRDKADIPSFKLENFRPQHRQPVASTAFGYNQLDAALAIPGFEIYSSEGIKPVLGPIKSAFYRISITISGGVDVQLGLEKFTQRPGTLCFTFPNQVFCKSNVQPGTFGYYILFNPGFLDTLIPSAQLQTTFHFFDYSGVPFIQLSPEEIGRVEEFVLRLNDEIQHAQPGKEAAVKMYLYLLLLEVKRSYERQQLHVQAPGDQHYLVSRFRKLVSQHFLTRRKVADYAALLAVTPNHLNRTIKTATDTTASEAITDMLAQEAKALLRHTDASMAEIAYRLNFSDPASFNRFFKRASGQTPLQFREHA